MSDTPEPNSISPTTIKGLQYARWAGRLMGVGLLITAVLILTGSTLDTLGTVKGSYFVLYGILLNLPFQRLKDSSWKLGFGALTLSSIGFVFLMIVSVMFAYMEMAELGERLGVPGLEGSLIFVALMQVPVVLFQRKPDLID